MVAPLTFCAGIVSVAVVWIGLCLIVRRCVVLGLSRAALDNKITNLRLYYHHELTRTARRAHREGINRRREVLARLLLRRIEANSLREHTPTARTPRMKRHLEAHYLPLLLLIVLPTTCIVPRQRPVPLFILRRYIVPIRLHSCERRHRFFLYLPEVREAQGRRIWMMTVCKYACKGTTRLGMECAWGGDAK